MSEYESKLSEVLNSALEAGDATNPAEPPAPSKGNSQVDPVEVMARWKVLQEPMTREILAEKIAAEMSADNWKRLSLVALIFGGAAGVGLGYAIWA